MLDGLTSSKFGIGYGNNLYPIIQDNSVELIALTKYLFYVYIDKLNIHTKLLCFGENYIITLRPNLFILTDILLNN